MGSIWVEGFGGLGLFVSAFEFLVFWLKNPVVWTWGLRDFSHGKAMDLLSDIKNATELGGVNGEDHFHAQPCGQGFSILRKHYIVLAQITAYIRKPPPPCSSHIIGI